MFLMAKGKGIDKRSKIELRICVARLGFLAFLAPCGCVINTYLKVAGSDGKEGKRIYLEDRFPCSGW
jgi:hypothetical protein